MLGGSFLARYIVNFDLAAPSRQRTTRDLDRPRPLLVQSTLGFGPHNK